MTENHPTPIFDEYCDFCNELTESGLYTGQRSNICSGCIYKLYKLPSLASQPVAQVGAMGPKEIKENLDRYVVGQHKAKKLLSVAVYNHLLRTKPGNSAILHKTKKSNVLLIGPSGSGKTLLVKTLAKFLDIPLIIVDATAFSEAGYAGRDVAEIIEDILTETKGNVERAERCIVFVDEFDKIAAKEQGKGISDVSVQTALLKLVEGSVVVAGQGQGGMRLANKQYTGQAIRTDNILFIFGGAFSKLPDIVNGKKVADIGFTSSGEVDIMQLLDNVTQEHLITFGLIPEIVGRIQTVAALSELSHSELKDAVSVVEDSLMEHYSTLFSLNGISLEMSDEFIDAAIVESKAKKLGVRGIHSILEKAVYPFLFDSDIVDKTKPLVLTKKHLTNQDSNHLNVKDNSGETNE